MFTTEVIRSWRKELTQYADVNYEEHEKSLLEVYGIIESDQKKPIFIDKFVRLLCSPGRNTGKYQKNYKRVLLLLEEIKKTTNKEGYIVFLDAVIKSAIRVQVRYMRQGSISVSKRVFLTNAKIASTTLREFANIAKSIKNMQKFATEIINASKNDQKSQVVSKYIQTLKLAKVAGD
jgi:ribosomal protein S7